MTLALRYRLAQARALAREIVPAVRALRRAAAIAAHAIDAQPGLAVLAGPAVAVDGAATSLHVRIVNPTTTRREVRVRIDGDGGTGDRARFHVEWQAVVEPNAVDDRWIVTTWRGDVAVHQTAPSLPLAWPSGTPTGRWDVRARLDTGVALAINGALVQ